MKVAKTLREASDLVEAGFDCVADVEDAQIFRKTSVRKSTQHYDTSTKRFLVASHKNTSKPWF